MPIYECAEHLKFYSSEASYKSHMKKFHASTSPGSPAGGSTSTPKSETKFKYPTKAAYESAGEGAVSGPPKGATPPQPAQAPIGSPPPSPTAQPAVFDSTGLWEGLGAVLDEYLLADEKVKINMDHTKAVALDVGLKQMGIYVEAPVPIIIPNWAPFLITVAAVFGPAGAVATKKVVDKIRERGKTRRGSHDAGPPPMEPPVTPTPSTSSGEGETFPEGWSTQPHVMSPVPIAPLPRQQWRDPSELNKGNQ
jgi:hypothetical protein